VFAVPPSPIPSALQRVSQGQYYADRTQEVLTKAESALDGFVGAATNIAHDSPERDVSRLGQELQMKVRKGERYLTRGAVNQDAYNKALGEAARWVEVARNQSGDQLEKQELSEVLNSLEKLSSDSQVEDRTKSVNSILTGECRSRLTEVENDSEGQDVSRHGRPVWNIFENSMVSLSHTRRLANSEKEQLEAVAATLRMLDDGGTP
jgi:hypothetical protein